MDEGGIRGNRGWPKCSLRAGIFTRSRGQKQRGRSPSRISVASEEGWAQEGVTMSREPCARIVFYSLLYHHHHRTSADTCAEGGKKRCSESILKGIHEYGCQGPSAPLLVIARSPPLSLTISRTPTPPPSYPLFLSFNLRLDCRLHILPLRPRSLSQLPFGLLSLLLLSLSSSSCYLMHTFSTVNFFLVISFLSFFSFLIQLFYSEIAEI